MLMIVLPDRTCAYAYAYDRPGRTPDDKLRWAFKMYDEDNSREVDMQEMENVMVVSLPVVSDDQDGENDLKFKTSKGRFKAVCPSVS